MMTMTLSSDSSVSQEPFSLTGHWMLCRSQGCLCPSLVWPGLPQGTAAVEVTLVVSPYWAGRPSIQWVFTENLLWPQLSPSELWGGTRRNKLAVECGGASLSEPDK